MLASVASEQHAGAVIGSTHNLSKTSAHAVVAIPLSRGRMQPITYTYVLFYTCGKEPAPYASLLEAAALPSVFTLGKEPFVLGKIRSAKFFSAKGLCRVLFIRALGKIKKFCRVLGAALGKIFSAIAAPAVTGYFAECPT